MTDIHSEPETVPDLLRARAEESPNAIAFSYEDGDGWRTITWGDFYQRARALAAALRAKGLEPGEHVGILAPTGLGWELFHHAILTAGGVVVGLEPHDVPDRLQWIADHAEIRMLVVQDAKLLEKLGRQQIQQYRAVIFLAGALPQSAGGDNLALWPELEAATASPAALPNVGPNASATLIYTSGTTGQPKGILYRHEQVALAVRAITRAYPSIQVGARFVCWLPLANLFQRIMNVAAMRIGGTIHLVANPLSVLKALAVAQPDVFIGVPRFYEKLRDGICQEIAKKPAWLRTLIHKSIQLGDKVAERHRSASPVPWRLRLAHRWADRFVLRQLRRVMGGGIRFMVTGSAPTPVALLQFFHAIGLPLYEAYGLSENIVPMALNRPGQFQLGTVGRPLEENTLRLDDDGELLVKGAGVFAGYFRDPRPDCFTADSFYRTGDYASFGAGGFLRLRGRKSEIIKTSTGRRISPVGIEAKIEESPYIDRAVVMGSGRKCLCAILSLNPGATKPQPENTTESQLWQDTHFGAEQILLSVRRCVESLAEHERPGGYLIVERVLSIDAGELTPNLKLKRNAIAEAFEARINALYERIEAGGDSAVPHLLVAQREP